MCLFCSAKLKNFMVYVDIYIHIIILALPQMLVKALEFVYKINL